ncbi:NADH:ubiquinone oxidoreductase intermediate-associated protein 30 [Trichophaea hybrida]|nr:NADH:ubiquinone oxidoreductase intermediate-associated protein 30 [Trichophaea hybrida]
MAPIFPCWNSADWTPQNDSLRGGSSTSALTIISGGNSAVFSGVLDSRTLGGAGFASFRTTGTKSWNWSGENGLEIKLLGGNKRVFTLVLKTDIPEDDSDNEMSTVSYEYNFTPSQDTAETTIIAPFSSFKPCYRGRPATDAPPLNISCVKRMSFMVRSFFGKPEQGGKFRLEIESISPTTKEGDEDNDEWENIDTPRK